MSVNNGIKAHSVVKACLDVACSVRSRTVKITHTDCYRLCAALEIRTNGCAENSELIFVCRLNSDNGI